MSIRVITEPTIRVLGRMSADRDELAKFLADRGAPDFVSDAPSDNELLAECAGRECYNSFAKPRPGGNKAYADRIISEGHGRVLEHAVWVLSISGVSRSLAQELYTHTVGLSKSMLSQRYVDEGDCAFVVPPAYLDDVQNGIRFYELYRESSSFDSYRDAFDRTSVGKGSDLSAAESIASGLRWLASIERARDDYALLSEHGAKQLACISDKTARRKKAREAARSVLPNCVETRIVVTGNARAFRHFVEQRGSEHADAEIRRLAIAMLEVLEIEATNLFADMTIVDGCVVTPHSKV